MFKITGLILLFITIIVALLLILSKGKKTADNVLRILGIPVFLSGITIYCLCYLPDGFTFAELIVAFLHAIVSAGRMFLLNDDFQLISALPHNQALVSSVWFLTLFWLIHVLALIVSALALISVFGNNLIDWVRRHNKSDKDIYIICGVNDTSLCFAENIVSRKGRFVIFIDEECDKLICDKLRDMGCALIDTPYSPSNNQTADIFVKAGIKRTRRKNRRIYFLAFTDDYLNNGNLVSVALKTAQEEGISHDCFKAYALMEEGIVPQSLNEMAKHFGLSYDVQFFNECDLSARQLIKLAGPHEVMQFNNKTGLPLAGYEVFKVIILGFGSLGQQVFKKLLCSGQFEGSRFEAVIIDRNIHNITGQFKNRYPGIFTHYNIIIGECEVFSERFYEIISQHILDSRYIVVCLGDDNINLEAAADIDMIINKQITDRNYVGERIIAVNVRNKEHVFEDGLIPLQKKYILLGQYEQILTDEVLINDEMDAIAVQCHMVYCEESKSDNPWPQVSLFDKQSNRSIAAFIPAFLKIMGFKLVDTTNKGVNPVSREEFFTHLNEHPILKENLARTEHKRWCAFHFSEGWDTLPIECIRPVDKGHKDENRRLHACLVEWEYLETVSREVNRLLNKETNFQSYDLKYIVAIPEMLDKLPGKDAIISAELNR
jgi:hypothetical protein